MTMRNTYLVGFLIVVGLLSTSVYFQLVDGMTPCPLCTLQRITFGLLGMVFLAGIIWHRKYFNRLIINLSCLLTSCLGIFFAGRQVWLQNFPPPGNAECGASLQYMMRFYRLMKSSKKFSLAPLNARNAALSLCI